MQIKDKKTGKVYNIDWKEARTPSDSEVETLIANLNHQNSGWKDKIKQAFSDLKTEGPKDLLNWGKEFHDNLTQPFLDLEPLATQAMEKFQPDDPGSEFSPVERIAYGQLLNFDSDRDERAKIRGIAKGGAEGVSSVLSPSPMDVATLGAATEARVANKAVTQSKKVLNKPTRKGVNLAEPKPFIKNPGRSNQPSQQEVWDLQKDPMIIAANKRSAPHLRREQVKQLLQDSDISAEQAAKIEEQYFAGAEDMWDAAKKAGVEGFHSSITGAKDGKEALAASAISKFADKEIDLDKLSNILKENGVSAQKVQSMLKAVGIKPREVGLSARDLKQNPRAPEAINPRALGKSPRQQKTIEDEAEYLKEIQSNIEYPEEEDFSLKMAVGVPDDPKAAAAASAVNKAAADIDLDNLPDKIPASFIKKMAQDQGLDEDALKTVLKQKYKQQQVRNARKAVKAAKAGSAQSPVGASSQALTGTPPSGAGSPPSGPPGKPSVYPASSSNPGISQGPMLGPGLHKPLQKDAGFWENLFGIPKSLKSVIDQPFLRQSVTQAAAHPIDTAKAWKEGMRAYSEPNYNNIMAGIEHHPRFQQMKDFGVLDPDVAQSFPSNWAEKVPGVRASERNYTAGMDTLRTSRFDDVASKIEDKFWQGGNQGPIDPAEYRAAANYVGDTTGKGRAPDFPIVGSPTEGNLGKAMNMAFWSPKLRASRFSLMNPVNYTSAGKYQSPSGVPLDTFRKDMGKFGLGLSGSLGLGALAGADVELDPRSSDFAQMQFDDTRLDLTGGMRPIANMAARSGAGLIPDMPTYKSSKDDSLSQANPSTSNPAQFLTNAVGNSLSNLGRYARTGLAPGVPTAIGDLTAGREKKKGKTVYKNVVGEQVEPISPGYALDQVTPMYPQDVYEGYQDLGMGELPLAALSFLGAGQSTYGAKPNNTADPTSQSDTLATSSNNRNKYEKPSKKPNKKKVRRVY